MLAGSSYSVERSAGSVGIKLTNDPLGNGSLDRVRKS